MTPPSESFQDVQFRAANIITPLFRPLNPTLGHTSGIRKRNRCHSRDGQSAVPVLVNAGKGKRAGGCGNALFQGFLTIRLSELTLNDTFLCKEYCIWFCFQAILNTWKEYCRFCRNTVSLYIYILYCLKEMLHSKYRTLREILHLYGVLS